MCQFPVPMITSCQYITINYNIFPRKWLSFISLHTFLLYCYSCWIDCLLLKFGSYIIFIRPETFWGRSMVWRSRRRLCTFCFGCLTFVLVSSLSRSINKHDRHRRFLFLIGWFLKSLIFWNAWPNESKLGQKHPWKVLYNDCSFSSNPLTNKVATGHSFFLIGWFLKKSSPLKQLSQMNWYLVESMYGRSFIKIAHFVPIR